METYPGGREIRIHEAPTREGYTFDYWKGSAYQPGDAYTVTEDHTFVAQWKRNGEDASKHDGANGPSESSGSAITTPTVSAGRTTGSAPLAKTGDDPALALVAVAIGLLGASALVLARRLR
ncbi:MAG: InlB B-repeat-containing protein [Olsenella sp.]|nr:InlB B-repeat-containing protein [Olsenella sp.]